MPSSNSRKQAEYRKRMSEKGYSRIPVYAPTNAKQLRIDILAVTDKMVKEYERKNPTKPIRRPASEEDKA